MEASQPSSFLLSSSDNKKCEVNLLCLQVKFRERVLIRAHLLLRVRLGFDICMTY